MAYDLWRQTILNAGMWDHKPIPFPWHEAGLLRRWKVEF